MHSRDASEARCNARNGYYSARLTFRDAVIQLVATGLAKKPGRRLYFPSAAKYLK
jgi:hypothetical protein